MNEELEIHKVLGNCDWFLIPEGYINQYVAYPRRICRVCRRIQLYPGFVANWEDVDSQQQEVTDRCYLALEESYMNITKDELEIMRALKIPVWVRLETSSLGFNMSVDFRIDIANGVLEMCHPTAEEWLPTYWLDPGCIRQGNKFDCIRKCAREKGINIDDFAKNSI